MVAQEKRGLLPNGLACVRRERRDQGNDVSPVRFQREAATASSTGAQPTQSLHLPEFVVTRKCCFQRSIARPRPIATIPTPGPVDRHRALELTCSRIVPSGGHVLQKRILLALSDCSQQIGLSDDVLGEAEVLKCQLLERPA